MPTRWGPDTCRCTFDFNDGPRQLPTFITRCAVHLTETEEVVVAECAGKNAAWSLLTDAGVAGADIVFRFTPAGRGKRVCTLSVPADSPVIVVDAIIARLAECGYKASFSDRIVIVPRR